MIDKYEPTVDAMIRMHMLRKAHMIKNLNDAYGLHFGQHPILKFIAENEGCTQKEIADQHGVTAASIAQSTKRMQNAGLIQKSADSSNLRINRLKITEKGKIALIESEKLMDALDEKSFQGFSDMELKQLTEFLERINNNLSDIEIFCLHKSHCGKNRTGEGKTQS